MNIKNIFSAFHIVAYKKIKSQNLVKADLSYLSCNTGGDDYSATYSQ